MDALEEAKARLRAAEQVLALLKGASERTQMMSEFASKRAEMAEFGSRLLARVRGKISPDDQGVERGLAAGLA